MKQDVKTKQQAAITEFLKVTAAMPSKRYPIFVWKIPAIYPTDIFAMFKLWQDKSAYNGMKLFKTRAAFLEVLYKGFDSLGLNWRVKTSYGRDKIYFGNLRLKEYGCKLLMKVGAKTFLGK